MRLVIDIDDKTYAEIKKGIIYSSIRDVPLESVVAIANGTPLPKGHGRLIDADKALDYFTTNMNWVDEEDNRIDNSAERKAIFKEYFDGVSTILEADMNREGEK